ncbi:MAG: 2-oxoglutarate and iron-dependent oxygenase domain-containing protein, partial [Stellaceae bacterium]
MDGLAQERKRVTRLPVIDLAPFVEHRSGDERRAMALALREASIDLGFFYLAGHGIPEQEFDEAIAMAHRFFELPMAEKMKLHGNNSAARLGYRGPGGPNPGANPGQIPDIKERFHMNREVLPGEPEAGRRGAGLSQWPEERVLPGFREVMQRHIAKRCAVAQQLARAFALSLDLPEA